MSSNYSANQYENAYKSQKMQNWCVPKSYKERPTAREGHSTFIANDRGHLVPELKRGSAWPDFKGTWDLPARIPARYINPTSRSVEGSSRLAAWGLDPKCTATSQSHGGAENTARAQAGGEQATGELQQGGAPSSRPPTGHEPASAARPPSQNLPITGGERPTTQGSQGAREGPATLPGETAAAIQATEGDRPVSQGSRAGERPATRPNTGGERPVSQALERTATQHSSCKDRAASQGEPPSSSQGQRDTQQDH